MIASQSKAKTQIGIALPQIFTDGKVDMGLVRDFVTQAEAIGYHSVWVQEQVLGSAVTLEPLSLLTYISAITSTIRLGVSVMVLPLHNPVQLAKSVSTVDQMSGGRLMLGVGLGAWMGVYPAFGISQDARVARFTENVRIMKALWTQESVDYAGRFHVLKDAHMEPKPAQKPHPPLWFGVRQPEALRRAVRYGDGWMGAGSSTLAEFKSQIETVKGYLVEEGKNPETFGLSKRIYLAVDDDEARAERRLRDWFGHYYRNADMAPRVCVWGSAERCMQTIREIQQAGANHLLLNPLFDSVKHLSSLADLTKP